MKRVLNLTLVLSFIIIGSAMAQGPKWGQNMPTVSFQSDYCTATVANLPLEDVSDAEKADLLYMREEEKLAKDIYLNFFQKWGYRIFGNIARSEQTHENAIKGLLVKYAITDPAAGNAAGVFTEPHLQKIYNDLAAAGNISLTDALKVGATVEELDISDLEQAIEEADSKDIQVVFQNLMKGSRNHLRNYVRMLKLYGQSYEPQYLSSEEVKAITDSPMERGIYDENGTSLFY